MRALTSPTYSQRARSEGIISDRLEVSKWAGTRLRFGHIDFRAIVLFPISIILDIHIYARPHSCNASLHMVEDTSGHILVGAVTSGGGGRAQKSKPTLLINQRT